MNPAREAIAAEVEDARADPEGAVLKYTARICHLEIVNAELLAACKRARIIFLVAQDRNRDIPWDDVSAETLRLLTRALAKAKEQL